MAEPGKNTAYHINEHLLSSRLSGIMSNTDDGMALRPVGEMFEVVKTIMDAGISYERCGGCGAAGFLPIGDELPGGGHKSTVCLECRGSGFKRSENG